MHKTIPSTINNQSSYTRKLPSVIWHHTCADRITVSVKWQGIKFYSHINVNHKGDEMTASRACIHNSITATEHKNGDKHKTQQQH